MAVIYDRQTEMNKGVMDRTREIPYCVLCGEEAGYPFIEWCAQKTVRICYGCAQNELPGIMADKIEMMASLEIRRLLSRQVILRRSTADTEVLKREHEKQELGYLLSQLPIDEPGVVPMPQAPRLGNLRR